MANGIVICVLKSGGEFNASHVRMLREGVLKHNPDIKFFCLSDVKVDGISTIFMQNNWPKWWPKIELFNIFVDSPVLYLDLDTVVTGDITGLFRDKLTMLKDVNNLEKFGSGVMSWNGDYSYLYDEFNKNPDRFMKEYKTRRKWGDQSFIMDYLQEKPDSYDFGELYSYKAHCLEGVPEGTKLVYFHGKPRPWEVDLNAIRC